MPKVAFQWRDTSKTPTATALLNDAAARERLPRETRNGRFSTQLDLTDYTFSVSRAEIILTFVSASLKQCKVDPIGQYLIELSTLINANPV